MLGENGTGKTTFIRMLAGSKGFESDNGEQVPSLNVSQEFGKIDFQAFLGFIQAPNHQAKVPRVCQTTAPF